ncbi:MAG: OB-fold domain-containing protein [Thermoplasmata archaeon]|nr:OB-fold domain-containing protein [Thermoplasmata archaeon]
MVSEPPALHSIADFRSAYEEGRRIRGFRSACGFVTATWGLVCPNCGKRDLAEADLSGRGVLAAFSVQTVPSDEFLNDAPYAYVVVDLEEGGRITGWIDGIARESDLAIGTPVEWVASYKPGVHFHRATAAAAGNGPR